MYANVDIRFANNESFENFTVWIRQEQDLENNLRMAIGKKTGLSMFSLEWKNLKLTYDDGLPI